MLDLGFQRLRIRRVVSFVMYLVEVRRRFEETHCLHIQGRRVRQGTNKKQVALLPKRQ
jgi:hypothetical protein